jgi:acyl carrier protein
MTKDEIAKIIIDALTELQRVSGRPCGTLSGKTTPIGDLVGFDSLSAIEATVAIEKALGREFDTDNLLVAEINGQRRALTIAAAAERIVKQLGAEAA